MTDRTEGVSRRAVLGGLFAGPWAAAPLLARGAWAQESQPMALPLTATRLEHLGSVVPDVTAAARFHSALFNPAIRTERQPDPLRYYVDLNGGYLAFGSRAGAPRAFFDHYCALIAGYDAVKMAMALRNAGVPIPASRTAAGLFPDPDGIDVQLFGDPGGWSPTVIDAPPLVEGPPLLTPFGLGHVSLTVSDIGRSRDFYRTYFGQETGPNGNGQVWYEMGGTNLVLTQATADGPPAGIDHIGIKVADFDFDAITAALNGMGARVDPPIAGQFGPVLRFTDPQGLVFELEPQPA